MGQAGGESFRMRGIGRSEHGRPRGDALRPPPLRFPAHSGLARVRSSLSNPCPPSTLNFQGVAVSLILMAERAAAWRILRAPCGPIKLSKAGRLAAAPGLRVPRRGSPPAPAYGA